jgi:hypothetical protein
MGVQTVRPSLQNVAFHVTSRGSRIVQTWWNTDEKLPNHVRTHRLHPVVLHVVPFASLSIRHESGLGTSVPPSASLPSISNPNPQPQFPPTTHIKSIPSDLKAPMKRCKSKYDGAYDTGRCHMFRARRVAQQPCLLCGMSGVKTG